MNRILSKDTRYRTEWYGNGTKGKRIVVARIAREGIVPADLNAVRFDAMLEQAIADDLHHNDGKMFGHDTLAFFTQQMTYPEWWSCIELNDDSAVLQRVPSHPHQAITRYRYIPSHSFGGSSLCDRPKFYLLQWKEAEA